MNLDELQSVRDRERQTDSLQQLRETFYADAGEFIRDLRARREQAAERADDPFDAPEVDRLNNEIEAAEETVEAIYEKRLGKLVKAASLAAAGMTAQTEGMTAEEQQLFETLVADIESNRQYVLDVLAGEETEAESAGTESTATTESPEATDTRARQDSPASAGADEGAGESVDAAEVMGGSASARDTSPADGTEDVPEETGAEADDRETVRITADVDAFLGVDEREYDLSEDDVVQLPAQNAGPLVERDAAERLE